MVSTATGTGGDVIVGVAVGALVGVWVGTTVAVEVGEADGTGKDAVGDGCRAECRQHAAVTTARIVMHSTCLMLIAYLHFLERL
jgi:hypothetical protein